jgi:hypothetical protein
MLTENEVRILELLSRRLLAKSNEIRSEFEGPDGIDTALQKLISINCVKVVEPIGEKCFVITQKGTKLLREMKNPEKRAQPEAFLTS